jgi:hypothetical protein
MTEVDPIGNVDYTYMQAANVIAARIKAGEITHQLPAERDLARELGKASTPAGRGRQSHVAAAMTCPVRSVPVQS